jgi:leucyl aminopeptidase
LKDAVCFLARDGIKDMSSYYATRAAVESIRGACYRFDELKSKAKKKPRLARFGIGLTTRKDVNAARLALGHGQAIANGMALARDLGNRPANVCTPSHMAQQARSLAKRFPKMEVNVLGERDMKRYKMGAMLSVTAGATEPARLIVLRYKGAPATEKPVALVGKGVTFDTGGISLKPPPEMDEMKYDMCGAGGVLGSMAAIGEIQPRLNVVAVIPACENMPSGTATRPGDIVTTGSGQTVEILNTDAEGRLILSDALTYVERFKPRLVIDVATLTGACLIALGNHFTGMFTSDDELAEEIAQAGNRSHDPVWRLPVTEEYADSLKSNFADFANVGGRYGGASIAAAFLAKFTNQFRWAHLDIAGTAWKQGKEKGATGRPVPLLTDLLLELA